MNFLKVIQSAAPALYAALIALIEKGRLDPALEPTINDLEAKLSEPFSAAALANLANVLSPEVMNALHFKFEPRQHSSSAG